MRYDSAQFGAFDGRDNRKSVMDLLGRLPSNERRASFLRGLIAHSTSGFAGKAMQVPPCETVQAYHYFVAITGVLNVPIEEAAKKLESEVRRGT